MNETVWKFKAALYAIPKILIVSDVQSSENVIARHDGNVLKP